MDNDITFGGFIPSNIRRSIIKECFESGDPENYWRALLNEVETMDFNIMKGDIMDYLNEQAERLGLTNE